MAVVLTMLVAACDSGPRGPGTIQGVAEGSEVGGVVLEIQGAGIRGFSARGSARLYSAAVQERPRTYRVILISPDLGALAFDVEVDDLGMDGPVVTVVSAADGENRAVSASNVSVRLER